MQIVAVRAAARDERSGSGLYQTTLESRVHDLYQVMSIPEIPMQIDAEIVRLKQVRNILADETSVPKLKAKRTLSAEARQRIGEAQRRRRAEIGRAHV